LTRHDKITNSRGGLPRGLDNEMGRPMKTIVACLCAFLLQVSLAAAADDAAVRRCRGIVDASARLACYDALPLGSDASVKVQAPPAAAANAPAPAAAAAPAGAVSGTGAKTLTTAESQQQFGLQPKALKEPMQSIETNIPGHFEGWAPRMKIALANGQVWRIDDGSSYSLPLELDNPRVVIRRGAFGTFYMDIANDNHSPRVVRVQ
jgi:hypothetical protein